VATVKDTAFTPPRGRCFGCDLVRKNRASILSGASLQRRRPLLSSCLHSFGVHFGQAQLGGAGVIGGLGSRTGFLETGLCCLARV